MITRSVYGQLARMMAAPTSQNGSELVHHAAKPKNPEMIASDACIAKPRLYADFHWVSRAQSSSRSRAGCSATLTYSAAPANPAAATRAINPNIVAAPFQSSIHYMAKKIDVGEIHATNP